MSLLGFCLRGRRVGEIVSLEGLGDFYTRAGLPGVAAEVHAWHSVRRSPTMGPEAMISRYVKSFDVEDTQMGWLTGILLGYPLWTTAARYHSGALTLRPADRRGGEAACEAVMRHLPIDEVDEEDPEGVPSEVLVGGGRGRPSGTRIVMRSGERGILV